MNIILTFIILSIVNVIFSTIRSITTIKSGKTVASLISGGYFAFYNIMLLYTVADFPMWVKCIITFICNVIGVWTVKFMEEKLRKDKLWKIEFTVKSNVDNSVSALHHAFNCEGISHNYIECGKYTIFNCYCATKEETEKVKSYISFCGAKYFASETKIL